MEITNHTEEVHCLPFTIRDTRTIVSKSASPMHAYHQSKMLVMKYCEITLKLGLYID